MKGTLEQLREDTARKNLEKRRDGVEGAVALGIRSPKGYLTPFIFYADDGDSKPEEAYGHPVHFQEGVWSHGMGDFGNELSFDQRLTDLEAGKEYGGSADIESLSPKRLWRLRMQAKKPSDKSGIRF